MNHKQTANAAAHDLIRQIQSVKYMHKTTVRILVDLLTDTAMSVSTGVPEEPPLGHVSLDEASILGWIALDLARDRLGEDIHEGPIGKRLFDAGVCA